MPREIDETAVAELIHSLGLLVRRVRAAAAEHGLPLTESAVLARLSHDGPASIADLARAEGMRPQSMGAVIAALTEAGLVRRKPHPTDGRQRVVELTGLGAAERQGAREAKRTWLAQAIARLDKSEQAALFAAGEILRRVAGS